MRFDALYGAARIAPALRVVLQLMHTLLRSGIGILQRRPGNVLPRKGVGRSEMVWLGKVRHEQKTAGRAARQQDGPSVRVVRRLSTRLRQPGASG